MSFPSINTFCNEWTLCCTGVPAAAGINGRETLESLRCCWGNSALSISLDQMQSEMDILCCMLRRVVWGLIYRTGNYMSSLSYLLCASGWDSLTLLATPESMQVQGQASCFAAKGCSRFQLLGGIWGCPGPHCHVCSLDSLVELGPGMPLSCLPVAVLGSVLPKHAVEHWHFSYSRFTARSVGKEAHVVPCNCSVDIVLRGMPRDQTPLFPLMFDGNEECCLNMKICIKLWKPVFEIVTLYLSV